MDYDINRLKSQLRDFPWFRTAAADPQGPTYDGFALFNYTPWHIAKQDDELRYVSSLIIDYKKNEDDEPQVVRAAREAVRKIAIEALHDLIWRYQWKGNDLPANDADKWHKTIAAASSDIPGDLGQGWHDWMLIPAPGHGKGVGKSATRAFADALCSIPWYPDVHFGDPPHLAQLALERHTAQEPSHTKRKSLAQHLETMRLIDEPTPESEHNSAGLRQFMLVDDVYTTGATYGAGKQLLRARHPDALVMGMFVAITAY